MDITRKESSDPPLLETRKPLFTHPTPHPALSRESERWFNFHTGSPCAPACQMWQITCVGVWVWSSVHWVRADSSSSFNLSLMDLEPGTEGISFYHWNTHPTLSINPEIEGEPAVGQVNPAARWLVEHDTFQWTCLTESVSRWLKFEMIKILSTFTFS